MKVGAETIADAEDLQHASVGQEGSGAVTVCGTRLDGCPGGRAKAGTPRQPAIRPIAHHRQPNAQVMNSSSVG